jgi:AraC-like DNA-binding protein
VVQPFHRPLFLLTQAAEVEVRLRQVIERPFALIRVADLPALRNAVRSAPQTAICFVDAVSGEGSERGIAEGIRDLTREFPLLAVVACLPPDCAPDVSVLLTLRDWGVAEILDLTRDTSEAAVAQRIADVKDVWAERLFLRVLPRSMTARGRALVNAVADVAAQGGHVPELAQALGIDERTVPRWCSYAGVPHARRLFSWIRLLLVADPLMDPRLSFETVARASGYSSAASLKSTTKTFTGYTPTELRERGAFNVISELFRADLRSAREAFHTSKRQRNSWYN